jgi:hypothetical protein
MDLLNCNESSPVDAVFKLIHPILVLHVVVNQHVIHPDTCMDAIFKRSVGLQDDAEWLTRLGVPYH